MQKVTLDFLRRRVRRLADEQSSSGGASSFVSPEDLDDAINEAIPSYYALLTEVQEAFLSKLEWLIVIGTHKNRLWDKATVALPAAVPAERDGTFTNLKGIVQKFEKAVEPLGEAVPQWEIWQRLARRMNAKWSYDDTHQVFRTLAEGRPEYDTLNWYDTFGIEKALYPDNW